MTELAQSDRDQRSANDSHGAGQDAGHGAHGTNVELATVRLGRFVLLELLGRGGMGEVYSAYDPNLDRRVALKLLRPRAGRDDIQQARARLLREAQALARLSHPNIVPVHEVGVLGDQVFVVMEFVEGKSLRAFAGDPDRTWREIVAVYLQAAEGLSSAHQASVVHRDFKPDNAIVGTDMRVRVIDFGLARDLREHPPGVEDALAAISLDGRTSIELGQKAENPISPYASTMLLDADPTPAEPLAETLPERGQTNTATRALLGTPAYMSPEQYQSAKVGPATDQFSFCVSLYEALYGRRPFEGSTLEELREQTLAGNVPAPARHSHVPPYIHAVLCRGLATDPAQRYPSMRALANALARDPSRRRRRAAGAVLVASALVAAGYGLFWYGSRAPRAADTCQGGEREIGRAWSPARRSQVRASIEGTGSAYAGEAWSRVERGLDEYSARWLAVRMDACTAHREGVQSGELLDRRMGCLERRLAALDRGVAALTETTRASLPNVVDVVLRLPAIEHCSDIEALTAEVAPPESPELAAAVKEQRSRLDRIHSLEHMGRYSEALEQVDEVAEIARTLDYPPLLADTLLTKGRILLLLEARNDAAEPLDQSALIAVAAGMNTTALEALARLIYVQGSFDAEGARKGLILAPYGQALAARPPSDAFAHALLLNNIGVVHLTLNNRERARELFEQALAVRQSHPELRNIELINVLQNLALVTPDDDRRRDLMRQAAAEFESQLGANHFLVLQARHTYSHYVSDPDEARALVAPICDAYQHLFPELEDVLAVCRTFQAHLASELGDHADAARHFGQASELLDKSEINTDRGTHLLTRGLALLHLGEYQAALDTLRQAQQVFNEVGHDWWVGNRILDAQVGTGSSLLSLGRHREAIEILRATLDPAREQTEFADDVEPRQRLAAIQRLLASAYIAAQLQEKPATACRAEPLELLRAAEDWYRGAGGYEHRLAELARLRDDYLAHCRMSD